MQKYVALVALILSLIITLLFYSQAFVVLPKIDSLQTSFKGNNVDAFTSTTRTVSIVALVYGVISSCLGLLALVKKSYTTRASNLIIVLALVNLIVLVLGVMFSAFSTMSPINDLYSGL